MWNWWVFATMQAGRLRPPLAGRPSHAGVRRLREVFLCHLGGPPCRRASPPKYQGRESASDATRRPPQDDVKDGITQYFDLTEYADVGREGQTLARLSSAEERSAAGRWGIAGNQAGNRMQVASVATPSTSMPASARTATRSKFRKRASVARPVTGRLPIGLTTIGIPTSGATRP